LKNATVTYRISNNYNMNDKSAEADKIELLLNGNLKNSCSEHAAMDHQY